MNEQRKQVVAICDACEMGILEGEVYDGPSGTDWEGAELCVECHKEIVEDWAAYHGLAQTTEPEA